MARFYGTIQGNRGEATRLGHTGLTVSAQSYDGDIVVRLWKGENGFDGVTIEVRQHQGPHCFVMYNGLITSLVDLDERKAQMLGLGLEQFMAEFDQGQHRAELEG